MEMIIKLEMVKVILNKITGTYLAQAVIVMMIDIARQETVRRIGTDVVTV